MIRSSYCSGVIVPGKPRASGDDPPHNNMQPYAAM